MKTNQPWDYLAPEIEVFEISAEQGFATSPQLEEPEERDDQGW